MADLKATEQRSKPLHEVGQSTANEIQIDNYQDAIMLAVHNHWRLPPNVDRSMQPTVQIELNPDGDLRRARVINSSGNRALDESAIDAIAGVGRFGVPDDIILFERHFRRFNVTFTPEF